MAMLWPLPQMLTTGDASAELVANASSSFFGAAPTALLARAFGRYAKLLPRCGSLPGAGVVSRFELQVGDPEAPGPAEFMDESYELDVPTHGVVLARAATQWGALRALETFSQIAVNCSLEGLPVRVVDAPRFTHRGIMLDLARVWWPSAVLSGVLDAMAHSKLNVLHLHLTDSESFMFESVAHPQLNRAAYRQPSCSGPGADGEPCLYRQAMLRQLVADATDRGVRVVPEFDMPGHSRSWGVGLPELVINCTGNPWSPPSAGQPHLYLDPLRNETWRVVGDLLAEAAAIFPDERMHLGADEVYWRCYNNSAAAQAAIVGAGRALDDDGLKWLVRAYLSRAQALVRSLGRRSSVWNEAFDIYGPGNHGFALGGGPFERTYSINTELEPGTAVQHWWGGFGSWYDTTTGRVDAANASAVIQHGHFYLNSEGWYLPISPPKSWPYNWTGMYTVDPATNKTCSYPLGGPPNCTCFEEGVPPHTEAHAVPGGGCYDIAPNAAGVYERLLGGEACLWADAAAGPYNASKAFRHLWPGGLAVAERLWSARNVADWRRAAPRLEAQMERLERRVLRGAE